MKKHRVLIVDDSVVVRRILSVQLAKEEDIEVAGVAANGKIALAMMTQVNPDILILDVHMSEMDGLTLLKELRQKSFSVPVIMLSSSTQKSAEITLEALALGANDYVAKPEFTKGLDDAVGKVCAELAEKIRLFCTKSLLEAPSSTVAHATPRIDFSSALPQLVLIGVSTGGPTALSEVIPAISADFPVPIALVQHMPAMFTKMLAERLTASSKIRVIEAQGGEILKPGNAYLAPGGYHLILERQKADLVTCLTQTPPVNSCRPSVDVLFESAAPLMGSKVLAIVLTGMGEDGKRGCEAIADRGGFIIAQDEATSVVWGMPGAVVKAELADRILPLRHIAAAIEQYCRKGFTK